MKRLVFGILAHVDSGKTTLSEALLYRSGDVRKLGRVDHGDAFLDTHSLERARGITIFSKQAQLNYQDVQITLLDTPGHVDFSPEMERTLSVLDYAVLVISGTDGVQSHTETLWQLLTRYRVPTFVYVNKMDLHGADRNALMIQLKHRLGANCVDFTEAGVQDFAENIALCDETLMESFLENGTIAQADIASAISARNVFPCYFGSALRLTGVDSLLDGIAQYTQEPLRHEAFGAKVFKIAEDAQGARLTYLKVTGGALQVRSEVSGTAQDHTQWTEKVNQIRVYSGTKFTTQNTAPVGTICAVTGLTKTWAGQGIGAQDNAQIPVLEPVLTYRMDLPQGVQVREALAKLRKLEEEEPQLHVFWNEQLQELQVQLMGEVQLEVLQSILAERFALPVTFGQGSIIYKETISATVEGVGHYEPLRHYAEVHLLLEPGKKGSDVTFATDCREEMLGGNWQRLVLTHLEEKVHKGTLIGAPITDVKITLIAGRAHLKHTEGGDFRQATYRAVRQGLLTAHAQQKTVLLEPWYKFRLNIPLDAVGRALHDLQRRNATIDPPETMQETAIITGSAPVACLQDYQQEVIGYTKGAGRLACTFQGYEPCHNTEEVVAQSGYDNTCDLENTGDSVFCTHGAGFAVKWNDVPQYMHIDTRTMRAPEPQQSTPPKEKMRQRAASYCASLEQDKELLAIFERTYGKVKRKGDAALHTKPVRAERPYQAEPVPQGPEYLLVDGYNVIFAWEHLSELAKTNLEAARAQLVQTMCNYAGFRKCNLILVFDAYKVKGNVGEVEQVHNITVVYTKEAETADMYIEKATHKMAKQYRVRVVTSDAVEQLIILGHGATRVSASLFKAEVQEVETAIRAYLGS